MALKTSILALMMALTCTAAPLMAQTATPNDDNAVKTERTNLKKSNPRVSSCISKKSKMGVKSPAVKGAEKRIDTTNINVTTPPRRSKVKNKAKK